MEPLAEETDDRLPIAAVAAGLMVLVVIAVGVFIFWPDTTSDQAANTGPAVPGADEDEDAPSSDATVENRSTTSSTSATSTTTSTSTSTSTASTTTSTTEPTTTTTTTAPSTTTTAPPTPLAVPSGSGCTPGPGSLPDGRWFGYATTASSGSIEFDLACIFYDEQADLAALEDDQPEEVPFDDFIRNNNPTTRTVAVGPEVKVTDMFEAETTFGQWAPANRVPIWLTISGGEVTRINEVFFA